MVEAEGTMRLAFSFYIMHRHVSTSLSLFLSYKILIIWGSAASSTTEAGEKGIFAPPPSSIEDCR